MEIILKKMNILLVFTILTFVYSCSNKNLVYPSTINLNDYDHYKRTFVSVFLFQIKTDTIWHDKPLCWSPDIVDEQAYFEIDSLVSLSLKKLWNETKIAVEPHDVKDYSIDEQCIANELLSIIYSKDLDKLATAYAKRKLKESKRLKKKAM